MEREKKNLKGAMFSFLLFIPDENYIFWLDDY